MRAKAKIEVAVKPEMKEAELCVLMNAGAPYTEGFDISEPDYEGDPGWITAFICAM